TAGSLPGGGDRPGHFREQGSAVAPAAAGPRGAGARDRGPKPTAGGDRGGGRLDEPDLRAVARWPGDSNLRATATVGRAADRSGGGDQRGGGDPIRDPDERGEPSDPVLSLAYRLFRSPPARSRTGSALADCPGAPR